MVEDSDVLKASGLVRYGINGVEIGRHTAVFLDKIVKGASRRSSGRAADEVRVVGSST
jgi:hypothetical protein